MSRWSLFASALLGAWILGAPGDAQPSARLPRVDGLPIWMTALADAPEEVREALEVHARMRRERLAPPRANADATWSRRTLAPWITRNRDGLREIEQRLGRSDAPLAWSLVGRVLHADLTAHLATSVLDLPLPAQVGRDPELRAVYTRTLEETMLPVLEQAREALRGCEQLAPRVEAPLDAWGARCRERGATLDERLTPLRASLARPSREAQTLRGPAEVSACTARGARAQAARVDEDAPVRVAVVYEGRALSRAADARRLEAEVSRALAARGHELVPARDLAAARRLVDGRRWEPRGPICAAPPPLPALLAAQHPTLLLAEVRERLCGPEPEPPPGVSSLGTRCSAKLEVRFRALDPRTPAPTTLEGQLDGSRAAHLLAAARRLEEVRMVGILGVLRSGGGGSFGEGNALGALGGGIGSVLTEDATSSALGARHALRVAGLDGPDPFVSPGSALYARGRELRTCFAGAGIGAFPVSFTIDASGAPTAVVVEHGIDLEGSDEARERARACVERVVSTLRFTCPRAGAADVSGHICIGG